MSSDVLVVGGGIGGIQAALDLAEMGLRVHLVESKPAIGGRMAQLDKTFPTNDCAICILSPKMADCARHPNVTLHTLSEVQELTGTAGGFQARVRHFARYVTDDCTGCGECAQRCPTKAPDEFDMALRQREAIYQYYLQGIPNLMTIDRERCLRLTKGRCGICQRVCQRQAIDYDQADTESMLDVGAVVVATGFDPYDPTILKPYGYGRLRNVITSLEYERLISASGPTGGHLRRLSDKGPVKQLAFIQCVGSRDVKRNGYCSSVCCMYASKEAVLANEHDHDVRSTVFYTDMRAAGRGFQDYIARAEREYGVTYVRGRVAEVTQDKDECPTIAYEDTRTGKCVSLTADLAVLAMSLIPRRGVERLATVLGVELDEHRFIATDPFSPSDTSRPGVFACGYCRGPADIPDTVAQASAAAMRAAEALARR